MSESLNGAPVFDGVLSDEDVHSGPPPGRRDGCCVVAPPVVIVALVTPVIRVGLVSLQHHLESVQELQFSSASEAVCALGRRRRRVT